MQKHWDFSELHGVTTQMMLFPGNLKGNEETSSSVSFIFL
jgi:hypothetical protein